MRGFRKIKDTEEDRARARLLAHFEDNPESVFYSRQLEVLFEREYFHWVTNRALRGLVQEGRIRAEPRQLSTGSEIKLLWHRSYRFYKRAADEVFKLVDWYTTAATDGALGMQGEHLVLAAFARQRFLLIGEETNTYGGITWEKTGHDLDFIFERDGIGYGVEVKNTLGYLDIEEFLTKIRLARHLGVKPVFAVRALPKTWANALIQAGGYAMIMGYQFYPWTHKNVADKIHQTLGLPVDTPKRIEQGTMQRFENWIAAPPRVKLDDLKVERLLAKMEADYVRPRRETPPPTGEAGGAENG
jgi:hypothetical protein